ncbi:MAG: hypothetical protein D6715_10675, partial [Calditrichaeota bacterium]
MLRTVLIAVIFAVASLQGAVSVVKHSSREIVLRLNVDRLEVEPVASNGTQQLYSLYYPDADILKQAGAPLIPYSRVRVIIPP